MELLSSLKPVQEKLPARMQRIGDQYIGIHAHCNIIQLWGGLQFHARAGATMVPKLQM